MDVMVNQATLVSHEVFNIGTPCEGLTVDQLLRV